MKLKYIDLSEAYADEKLNLNGNPEDFVNPVMDNDGCVIAGELDDKSMQTFLFECLDEEACDVHDALDIEFNGEEYSDDYELDIKLADDLFVRANVIYRYDITVNYPTDSYFDDMATVSDWKPFGVTVNSFEYINIKENLKVA